jgi:hypothetical protein
MALHVPNHYIPALGLVRNLSDSASTEFLRALESAHITSSAEAMAASIASSVPSIPKEDLGKITDLLYSLYHVREFSELNRNDFLKELLESVREVAKPAISEQEFPLISSPKHLEGDSSPARPRSHLLRGENYFRYSSCVQRRY